MNDYVESVEKAFLQKGNQEIATSQRSYMRNQYEFIGLKAPDRRHLQRPFLNKSTLPAKQDLEQIIHDCWESPYRDMQMFGQELFFKYKKEVSKHDVQVIEFMIINKSWWDTVDFIASNIVANYFNYYPEEIQSVTRNWMDSGNIWLQRTCLLFQLKYKDRTDVVLLSELIEELLGSKAFFINKAIGWILREYSKTNPQWVINYVAEVELNSLSEREALKHLKRKGML